nr:MAG TPA: hypothetical protein [Caudoviricetes sp.]
MSFVISKHQVRRTDLNDIMWSEEVYSNSYGEECSLEE